MILYLVETWNLNLNVQNNWQEATHLCSYIKAIDDMSSKPFINSWHHLK